MAFREVQKMTFASSFRPKEIRSTLNKVGRVELVEVDSCESGLPEPQVFDIETQLKAGIPLREVNTKVLGFENEVPDYVASLESKLVKTNNKEND